MKKRKVHKGGTTAEFLPSDQVAPDNKRGLSI